MWRVVIVALLVAGAFVGLGVPAAQAQEREGCYDPRGGSMGCVVDIRNFNFVDPALDDHGNWRMRGRVYVSYSDMTVVEVNPEGWPSRRGTWTPGTGR
jgi:hypothetical protein